MQEDLLFGREAEAAVLVVFGSSIHYFLGIVHHLEEL